MLGGARGARPRRSSSFADSPCPGAGAWDEHDEANAGDRLLVIKVSTLLNQTFDNS